MQNVEMNEKEYRKFMRDKLRSKAMTDLSLAAKFADKNDLLVQRFMEDALNYMVASQEYE